MENLKILQKTYDMIEYGYKAIEQFPKSEKFALGNDMKRCMHNILHLGIVAQKKYYKKTTLQELDVEITTLKAYTRLAKDLGFLPFKKYEVWSSYNIELGRMVGGWIRNNKQ
ncbi:MAG: diversity-generating retroelement protein Avd [Paraclostridium sp.]